MTFTNIGSFLCLWITVSTVTVHYPKINDSVSLTCQCPDHQCQKVFWYRYLQNNGSLQFLVFSNSLGMPQYPSGIDGTRYKTTVSTAQKIVYMLRINSLQRDDVGLYSCILHSQNNKQDQKDLMPAGDYIRPGETPPTSAPLTVKTTKKAIRINPCKSKNQSTNDCKPLVLWPLVSLLLALALALIATLFYFSRLPKRCRHQFTKKF